MPAFIETPESRETALYNKYSGKQVEPDPDGQEAASVGQALLDFDFWRQDVLGNAVTAGKNIAAQTVGFPSDMVGLATMIRAADPRHGPMIMSKLGVNSVWDIPGAIPGNSEQIAGWLGGDPNHASWLPGAFISPGPGEIKGGLAMLTGAGAVSKTAGGATKIGRYADFLKMEKELGMKPMDFRAVKETGWVRGLDDKPKFVISDADATIKHFDWVEGDNTMTLGDILDHPELYEIYPELADTVVVIKMEKAPDGGLRYVHQREEGEAIASFRYKKNAPSEIVINQARGDLSLKGSILHEAQHWIQEVEGWSTGATTYTSEFFENLGENLWSNRMLKNLNEEELSDPVVVNRWLDERGVAKEGRDDLLQTARIYGNLGEDSIRQAIGASDHAIREELRRAGHVFEYMMNRADVSEAEKIEELFKQLNRGELGRAILETMSHTAYTYKLGEVEARLTSLLKQSDLEKMSKMQDPVEDMLRTEAGPNRPPSTRESRSIVIGETGRMDEGRVADKVIEFEPNRLRKEARTIMDNISELESAIEKGTPMSVTMSNARYVLDNPELRGLMSQDRIDELNTVINKFLDNRGATVDYYDELIEAQEDVLRDILEKIPDLDGDIEDIIEGITPEGIDKLRNDKRLNAIAFERKYNGDPKIKVGTKKHDRILEGLAMEEQLLDDLEGGLDIDREEAERLLDWVLGDA